MKTLTVLSVVALAPFGGQFVSACLSGPDDLSSYVKLVNQQTAKALEAKDSHFFENLFTKDFKAKDEHGTMMGRKESLFVVRFQMNTIKVLEYKASSQPIKIEKSRGTIVTQAKLIGLTTARHGRPSEKLEITRKWSDIYQKQGTAWTLIYRTELVPPVVKTSPIALLVPAKAATPNKDGKHNP